MPGGSALGFGGSARGCGQTQEKGGNAILQTVQIKEITLRQVITHTFQQSMDRNDWCSLPCEMRHPGCARVGKNQ